jgi:hypothetical protein
MVDEQSISEPVVATPLPPVQLVPVTGAQPIMRAKTGVTVVAGSGDGLRNFTLLEARDRVLEILVDAKLRDRIAGARFFHVHHV